jgi:predicted signal transduction protein with EAL and GGDEF domain
MMLIGVPAADDTAEAVLARADRVMYQVKKSGKGRCHIATDDGAAAAGPADSQAAKPPAAPGEAA